MSNGFPSTQEAPLCNEAVKQASVKNGEWENSESASGSKTDFLLANVAMYTKMWNLRGIEN